MRRVLIAIVTCLICAPAAWASDAQDLLVRRNPRSDMWVAPPAKRLVRSDMPPIGRIDLPRDAVRVNTRKEERRRSVFGSNSPGYTPGWEVHTHGAGARYASGRLPKQRHPNDILYEQRRQSLARDKLPIFWEKLKERDINFPLPLGVNVYFSAQELLSRVEDLSVGLNNGPMRDIRFLEVAPFTNVTNVSFRPDAWILPFFNVFGILGHTNSDSSTLVALERLRPGQPPTIVKLPLERSGLTAGGGVVIAGGADWWFASGQFSWTVTDLGEGTSKIEARIYGVRVGWRGDLWDGAKIQLWTGATYWDTRRRLQGDVQLPGTTDTLQFDLVQGPITPITVMGGIRIDYRGMYDFLLEFGGLKDRKTITLGAAFRF